MSKTGPAADRHPNDPATWVDVYGDYLYSYAYHRTRDQSIAEDLVQETLLAALRAKDTFESRSSVKTWLTGILKHKIIDHIRKRVKEEPCDDIEPLARSQDEFFDAKGKWEIKPAKWNADPQKLHEQKEFMDVVFRCLANLSSRIAHVFTLSSMDGLKTEEICKLLNISATNCWVILYRARMHMRRCLEKNWFSPASRDES